VCVCVCVCGVCVHVCGIEAEPGAYWEGVVCGLSSGAWVMMELCVPHVGLEM